MTVQGENQRVKISLDLSPELYKTLKNVVQQFNRNMALGCAAMRRRAAETVRKTSLYRSSSRSKAER